MKAYDEGKGLFGALTFDDLGVTQGKRPNASKFYCLSLYNHLKSS